jgi:hypothetical protein
MFSREPAEVIGFFGASATGAAFAIGHAAGCFR